MVLGVGIMANWQLIKKEYCTGIPPRELAKKHKLTANTISNRASREEWDKEKQKKSEEIAASFEEKIKEGTAIAIDTLLLIAENGERDSDRVAAAKGLLDISGLKREKRELDGDLMKDVQVIINRRAVDGDGNRI
jgi:hypothetical protein